jgi:hypothetical protein
MVSVFPLRLLRLFKCTSHNFDTHHLFFIKNNTIWPKFFKSSTHTFVPAWCSDIYNTNSNTISIGFCWLSSTIRAFNTSIYIILGLIWLKPDLDIVFDFLLLRCNPLETLFIVTSFSWGITSIVKHFLDNSPKLILRGPFRYRTWRLALCSKMKWQVLLILSRG